MKAISIILIILLIIASIAAIVIFLIPIPYTAIEVYTSQEPYTVQEPYTTKEPYQEEICEQKIPTSWVEIAECLLSDCTECHLETRYRDVKKYQTVTKYRAVRKERKVTKYATLFMRWIKRVDYYYEV